MKTYLKELLETLNPELLHAYNGYEKYISIEHLGFLQEFEPIYNKAGVKLYKEWKYKNKVVLRMTYKKLFAQKGGFENTSIGLERKLNYLAYDSNGNEVIVFSKQRPTYMFNLVSINDLYLQPVGYLSKKSNEIISNTRTSAIAKLSSENPQMWVVFYSEFTSELETWENTGDSSNLFTSMDAVITEADETKSIYNILKAPSHYGDDLTVIDYIKSITN